MELPEEEEREALEAEPVLREEETDVLREEDDVPRETLRPDEEEAVARVVERLTWVAEVRLPEAAERLTEVPFAVLVTAVLEEGVPTRGLRETEDAPPTARGALLFEVWGIPLRPAIRPGSTLGPKWRPGPP